MPTPPVIQSLWIGDRLSTLERLCLASFLQHGHAVHLYVYGDVADVPLGVQLHDATAILPANRIFMYRKRKSYAGFSNLFRYKLLAERGGCWIDADLICLAPVTPTAAPVFASERIGEKRRRQGWLRHWLLPKRVPKNTATPSPKSGIATCFIQTPAGSEIMSYCYRESDRQAPAKLQWGQIGPRLLTDAVARFDQTSHVARPEMFCPIDWWSWQQAIEPNPAANLLADAQCVHLWNEMWHRNKVDKNGIFPASSLYEQLKRRFL